MTLTVSLILVLFILFTRSIGFGQRASALLFAAFMLIVMTTNRTNPDYINYFTEYDLIALDPNLIQREPGYKHLAHLASRAGLDFDAFRLLLAGVAFVCIWGFCVQAGRSALGLIWVAYLIFPFFLDVTQFRNFISYSLVLAGLGMRLSLPKKWGLICQVLLTGAAASIHVSALAYFLLLAVDAESDRRVTVLETFAKMAILVSVVLAATRYSLPLFDSLLQLVLPEDDVPIWSRRSGRYGYLIHWASQLGALFFASLSWREVQRRQEPLSSNGRQADSLVRVARLCYQVNLLATVFLPLYVYQSTYTRMYRNLFLVSYLFIAAIGALTGKTRSLRLYTFGMIIFIGIGGFALLYGPYFQEIIVAIFSDNQIERWFG